MAEKKLNVRRGNDFFYSIYFENDFSNLSHALKEEGLADKNICVVSDSNVAPRYLNEVMKELSEISPYVTSFVFEAGEKSSSMAVCKCCRIFTGSSFKIGASFVFINSGYSVKIERKVKRSVFRWFSVAFCSGLLYNDIMDILWILSSISDTKGVIYEQ